MAAMSSVFVRNDSTQSDGSTPLVSTLVFGMRLELFHSSFKTNRVAVLEVRALFAIDR